MLATKYAGSVAIRLASILGPLVLAIGIAIGCSIQSEGQVLDDPAETQTQPGQDESAQGDDQPEIVFFPESFAGDLDQLQLAIELQLESLVAECMAREGFTYTPLTVDEARFKFGYDSIGSFGETNNAQLALDSVFQEGVNRQVSPSNQTNVVSLTEEELAAWEHARLDCQASESADQESPWEAIGTDWWVGLQEDAASRVQSDARYLEAVAESHRCSADEGFGTDTAAVMNEAEEATAAVVNRYFDGELSEADARSLLAEQATDQQRLIESIERCVLPRISTERNLYVEYLNEAGQANAERLAEWLETAERELSRYREQLDELNEG